MADIDLDSLSEAVRAASGKRLARVLTSSTVLVVALYVLGFIYLKTYLAAFGFQIELASLSLPNLVLAHRFFVGQHFFVGAGVFHAFLYARFKASGLRKEWGASVVLLAFPVLLLPVGWGLSAWSEANTPSGFNISAPGLWRPFLLGWIAGLLCYVVAERSLRPLKSVAGALVYAAAVVVVAATVFTYRLYSSVTAADRRDRKDLQTLGHLYVAPGGTDQGPCGLVYADSGTLYLLCGTERHVVRKEALDNYVVK